MANSFAIIYEDRFEKLKLKSASVSQGLSVTQMLKLATDPNPIKREQVAAHPECPTDVLKELAEDPEYSVKEAVFKNTACPEELIAIRMHIAEDDPRFDKQLRELACLHRHAPADLLVRFVKEGSDGFLLTDRSFYCKQFLETKNSIKLDEIRKVDAEGRHGSSADQKLFFNGKEFFQLSGASSKTSFESLELFVKFLNDYLAL